MIEYFTEYNEGEWHVYSKVLTNFGGHAVNWITAADTLEEANDIIAKFENKVSNK
jgi:hypothetical protein